MDTHELEIETRSRELDKSELRKYKTKERKVVLDGMDSYAIPRNFEFGEVSSKDVFWVISSKGSFKTYLKLIGVVDDEWCRYCGLKREDSVHLKTRANLI